MKRKKELDVDPKAIQEMQFVRQSKNTDGQNTDGTQSKFVLTVLEKIKEARSKSKILSRKCNCLIKNGKL